MSFSFSFLLSLPPSLSGPGPPPPPPGAATPGASCLRGACVPSDPSQRQTASSTVSRTAKPSHGGDLPGHRPSPGGEGPPRGLDVLAVCLLLLRLLDGALAPSCASWGFRLGPFPVSAPWLPLCLRSRISSWDHRPYPGPGVLHGSPRGLLSSPRPPRSAG